MDFEALVSNFYYEKLMNVIFIFTHEIVFRIVKWNLKYVADTSEEEEETLPQEAPEDHETIPESDEVTEQEKSLSEEEVEDNQQEAVSDEEGEYCCRIRCGFVNVLHDQEYFRKKWILKH